MKKQKDLRAGGGIRGLLGVLGAFVLLFVILAVLPQTSSSFLQVTNLSNVVRQITVNIILACGLTMAILIGGIDQIGRASCRERV